MDVLFKVTPELGYSLSKSLAERLAAVTEKLAEKIRKRAIFFFFGAGPNLQEEVEFLKKIIREKRYMYFLTAADGAALALKDAHLTPDLIVSDLDGLNNLSNKTSALSVELSLGAYCSLISSSWDFKCNTCGSPISLRSSRQLNTS